MIFFRPREDREHVLSHKDPYSQDETRRLALATNGFSGPDRRYHYCALQWRFGCDSSAESAICYEPLIEKLSVKISTTSANYLG